MSDALQRTACLTLRSSFLTYEHFIAALLYLLFRENEVKSQKTRDVPDFDPRRLDAPPDCQLRCQFADTDTNTNTNTRFSKEREPVLTSHYCGPFRLLTFCTVACPAVTPCHVLGRQRTLQKLR
jgi:hypothetical protein